MLKKLGRHDGTDGVAPPVFRPRRATSIAVETREGLKPARLQLPAQYVSLDHASSIADENGATPRPGRKRRGPGETEAQWSHAWEDDGTESTVQSLIVDLLEWIGPTPRPYAEVQDAWRTSCPKLPVWEDAVDASLLDSWFEPGRGRLVAASTSGIEFLRRHGRDQAFTTDARPALGQTSDD